MDFSEILNLPVEIQVVMLTLGATQYLKESIIPEKYRDKVTFPISMLLGVVFMLLLKQSLAVTDAVAGLLLGFVTTKSFAIVKEMLKSVGTK